MTAGLTLSEEFALLLGEFGLGDYRPDTAAGTVFAAALPPDPDRAVGVLLYTAPPSDAEHGYDEPIVMFRVRDLPGQPVAAERRAQAVYDALHGLRRRNLPGGTVMLSCHGTQAGPTYVGADDQGRHEWSVMVTAELRRRTANRK